MEGPHQSVTGHNIRIFHEGGGVYIGTWDLHQGVMRNKKHLKRQAANIGKDGSRKCEEGQRYEQLGRAASMGGWGEDDPASQKEQLARGLKASSVQEYTGNRQEGNWKELLTRHSKLFRGDHHNFSHGQRDGLAQ